jgi:hypothetical protein
LLYSLAKTHASCAVVEQVFAGWSNGPVAHLAIWAIRRECWLADPVLLVLRHRGRAGRLR